MTLSKPAGSDGEDVEPFLPANCVHLKEAVPRKRLRSDRNWGREEDAPEMHGNNTFLRLRPPSCFPNN